MNINIVVDRIGDEYDLSEFGKFQVLKTIQGFLDLGLSIETSERIVYELLLKESNLNKGIV